MSASTSGSAPSDRIRKLLERLWNQLDERSTTEPAALMLTAELEIRTPCGHVRLGRDAEGMRHLLVPIAPTDRLEDDRRSVGVHLTGRVLLVEDLPVRFADLHCRRADLSGVFTGLVADVCARIAAEPEARPYRIAQTLNGWRLLFGGEAVRWTVPRLAGLFAELLILERLLDIRPDAVEAWQGPTGGAQDFRSNRYAIEVKASSGISGRIVHIHGVDQLEEPAGGAVDLAWFRIAESHGSSARSVQDLIAACHAKTDRVDVLDARLTALGLKAASPGVAADVRFEVVEERWHEVDQRFPKIVPASFVDGTVPVGVSGVEYLVDLDSIPLRADQALALDRLAKDL
ncbi:PD-(D/E)XK motif protein [Streptomyces albidoflavus]|uniref:PD-(D/E)XK motif protein n=1 Tax=Streptomyces albidoflavus TaxID=1886 RepID=UPI00099DADAE|nr:PD-(D/E)XK motif protein [Streptomyces albidoflavus]WSD55467.1 PD-(D/E)XK motif protein [Streptomyces albidoflavus]WTC35371.1 PD-(D/E)XK motif protein [Streptomyces albidoflavus]